MQCAEEIFHLSQLYTQDWIRHQSMTATITIYSRLLYYLILDSTFLILHSLLCMVSHKGPKKGIRALGGTIPFIVQKALVKLKSCVSIR